MSWVVTVIVVSLVLSFIAAALSTLRLPSAERPKTHKFDRLGRYLGAWENPDYHQQPGEKPEESPDV